MRDIPTIQGLTNRSVPATREHAATEFARLEHEKARLERELTMWIENQRKTESRLQHVRQRLTLLRQALVPPTGEDPPAGTRARRAAGGQAGGDESPAWREIKWEY
jgi:hypothetical protein